MARELTQLEHPTFQSVIPVRKQAILVVCYSFENFHLFNITSEFTIDGIDFLTMGSDTMSRKGCWDFPRKTSKFLSTT